MLSCGNLKLNSLDYVLVVDRDFNIIFNTRYESKVNGMILEDSREEYMNMNFFEAYPLVDKTHSSVVECITTGEIVIRKFQNITDYTGKTVCSNNITIPIIRKGQLVGVVELAKDITTVDDTESLYSKETKEFDEIAEEIKNETGIITFDKILTTNTSMLKNIEKAKFLANLPNPTLIYGETGTGKELFAQAIINYSGTPREKVVIQNCAAVPENLIESILFGTSRGAYTGAENKKGLFEQANGGILFLDELSAMPYHVQEKLLRVIQDGSFRTVGGNIEKKVNVKIIAAMNVDPVYAMENKILRDDLFYRFSSSMINILPLRERKEDIEYYIHYFIEEFNKIYGKNVKNFDDELKEVFQKHRWDGNVRELKHIVESMVGITREKILGIRDLPAYVYDKIHDSQYRSAEREQFHNSYYHVDLKNTKNFHLKSVLENKEKELILQALEYTKGNKTKAGKLLGIPRQTLKYKIDKMGLETKGSIHDDEILSEFLDADKKLSH